MRGSDTCELVFDDCASGRERAARGRQGRAGADERPRLRARRTGRRPARHHAGLPGRDAALRARTQAVRQADRHVPADAGQARRYVHDAECMPRLRVHRRARLRSRPDDALRRGRLHSSSDRARDVDGAADDPGAGRQRLRQRLPGGPPAARREAVRDRRGHQRNPPHADRPRTLRGDWHDADRRVDPSSEAFRTQCLVHARAGRRAQQRVAIAAEGGGEDARRKHSERDKLLPRERIAQPARSGHAVPRDRAARGATTFTTRRSRGGPRSAASASCTALDAWSSPTTPRSKAAPTSR